METLIRRRILQRLIWFCTVCLCPTKRTPGLYGLSNSESNKFLFNQNGSRDVIWKIGGGGSSGSLVECFTRNRGATGLSLTCVTALCPWARHINPSLVLIQPRKTHPFITQRLLMGRKESNQTNKIWKISILVYQNSTILVILNLYVALKHWTNFSPIPHTWYGRWPAWEIWMEQFSKSESPCCPKTSHQV